MFLCVCTHTRARTHTYTHTIYIYEIKVRHVYKGFVFYLLIAHAMSDLQRVIPHGKCGMYMYVMHRTFGARKRLYCKANQYKE